MWVFITVFILGMTLWSMQILMRQRMVWVQFAKRHNMKCRMRGFLNSPIISGVYKDKFITIFSDKSHLIKANSDTFRTILQFDLKVGIPVEGVIASPYARNFALDLKLPKEVTPDITGWNKGIVIRTQNEALLSPYLTPERLQTLNGLMSIKNTNSILLFSEIETFFRFETSDPLDDISRMEKQIGKIIDAVKLLEP